MPDKMKLVVKNRYKKPYIFAIEYEELRKFFGLVVEKMEAQVVLTKI
jgi:hypothetical protein